MSQPNEIDAISFHAMGTSEVNRDSVVEVIHKDLFKDNRPIKGGSYDAHMGTTEILWKCPTCSKRKTKCDGHSGSASLRYPCKNPLFIADLLKILKCICFECGETVISKDLSHVPKAKRLSEYVKLSRDKKCHNCGADHPIVMKNKMEPNMFQIETPLGGKEELFNHEIDAILQKIPDAVVTKVGKPLISHPRNYIIRSIRVPPNTIRPDIRSLGGNRSNNSNITAFVKSIIEQNEKLPLTIPPRDTIVKSKDIRYAYYVLDAVVHSMVKGSSGSDNKVKIMTSSHKTPFSLANRWPKKSGRFRRNILGKRVRYMIRSVITGDANIRINEIGIPVAAAKNIPYPETVSEDNIDELNTYYQNGSKRYPGCKGIIKVDNGKEYDIDSMDKTYQLKVGDKVMRHMKDGDYVLFNRQPSLTFSSIACHKVRVLFDSNSIRMNVSACNLYNADFHRVCR